MHLKKRDFSVRRGEKRRNTGVVFRAFSTKHDGKRSFFRLPHPYLACPKWSIFFPLWPCEDIQILQICPFFFCFLFDYQTFSIYNVLFIVGCRGERTVRIRKVEGSIPFVSTTWSQALYRLRPLFYKSQSALMPLLLLSKSNPLRWASIWFWAQI